MTEISLNRVPEAVDIKQIGILCNNAFFDTSKNDLAITKVDTTRGLHYDGYNYHAKNTAKTRYSCVKRSCKALLHIDANHDINSIQIKVDHSCLKSTHKTLEQKLNPVSYRKPKKQESSRKKLKTIKALKKIPDRSSFIPIKPKLVYKTIQSDENKINASILIPIKQSIKVKAPTNGNIKIENDDFPIPNLTFSDHLDKEDPLLIPENSFGLSDEDLTTNNQDYDTTVAEDIHTKRSNYLDWDEYFMSVSFLAAMRSKDPCTQVGACIVNEDKKIVGVGYNGMPIGCSDDEFPWKKNTENPLDSKYLYVCHAELNAVINKNTADIKNCTIYVGLFPCNECAKVIIQSGIKTVVYMSDKHAKKTETIAAKKMFDAANVTYRQYIPKHNKIVIDFSEINWNQMNQLPPSPHK